MLHLHKNFLLQRFSFLEQKYFCFAFVGFVRRRNVGKYKRQMFSFFCEFFFVLVHLVCCLFYDFVGGADEAFSFSPIFPLFLLFCSVNLNCIYSNFVDKACGLKRMQ